MKLLVLFIFYTSHLITSARRNFSTNNKRTIIDDYSYYNNYDYEINNNSMIKSDSLLLPNPDTIDSKYSIDILPNVELPDDSLADTDLKDHDFIDNLMYVYYGSHTRKGGHYGSEVIIIGSVLSCAAQLLTIFCVLLKKWNTKRDMKGLFVHMMASMVFSNLIFMLGVYVRESAIKSAKICLLIALVLHYIHLLSAFWMFLYCYYIYKRVAYGLQTVKYYYVAGYVIPFIFSIISYVVAPHSYETKRFCFMSVQKGMIINYMLPVSLLIVITTVFSLNGIYKINTELAKLEFTSSAESLNVLKSELETFNNKRQECLDEEVISLRESKSCLKLICGVQSGYDIVWFVAVLALENNSESNAMAVVYAITSFVLNCYIFFKIKTFLPTISYISENNLFDGVNVEEDGKTPQSKDSSDDIPLLVNAENGTEMRELRRDYISTIST